MAIKFYRIVTIFIVSLLVVFSKHGLVNASSSCVTYTDQHSSKQWRALSDYYEIYLTNNYETLKIGAYREKMDEKAEEILIKIYEDSFNSKNYISIEKLVRNYDREVLKAIEVYNNINKDKPLEVDKAQIQIGFPFSKVVDGKVETI